MSSNMTWPTKKLGENEKELIDKLVLILIKYEKLGLNNSNLYKELKENITDQQWVSKIAQTLNKVQNSERIFNISKEINQNKNDQRVLEMFAEFDVADRLVNTKFFGTFDELEYLPQDGHKRQPDFLAISGTSITPVEVKLLSPQDLNEKKFFQKLIDKVNDHAIEQLKGYYTVHKFKSGMIFIWTHYQIQLHNIEYYALKKYFKEKVLKQDFEITIICILSNLGLWDFYV